MSHGGWLRKKAFAHAVGPFQGPSAVHPTPVLDQQGIEKDGNDDQYADSDIHRKLLSGMTSNVLGV